MAPESTPSTPQPPYERWVRMGGALSAVALAAACQSGSEHPGIPAPTQYRSSLPASSEPAPTPSASEALSGYSSIRAVQPGEYLNDSYKEHIADHLELLRVAYTPGSNVDIDHDLVFRYIPMLHAMENDPMYAAAIKRASVIIKKDPESRLSADRLLSWDIPAPKLCAPERISDLDSGRQLAQTGDVGLDVGKALIGHLEDQTTRGARRLRLYLTGVMEWFGKHLNKELSEVNDPQLSRE